MSARPDWGDRETALASLLSAPRTASSRAQLLACLTDYSRAAVRDARTLGPIAPRTDDREQALAWLLRPVFICGHHRSGTTLLQNLLDGHPELLSLPSEGTYFDSFAYVARRAIADSDMDRFAVEWISRFVDPNFEPHFKLGRYDGARMLAVDFARFLFGWHAALRSRVPGELAPLLALVAAYRAVAAPASAPRSWVEKTPLNERHVGRLAFFGAARFIQLIRDPRAVLASLDEIHRTAELGRLDVAESARAIGRSLRLADRNPRRLGNRYLVVRYEDLVGEPAQQIERLRRFLDIAPHATLSVPPQPAARSSPIPRSVAPPPASNPRDPCQSCPPSTWHCSVRMRPPRHARSGTNTPAAAASKMCSAFPVLASPACRVAARFAQGSTRRERRLAGELAVDGVEGARRLVGVFELGSAERFSGQSQPQILVLENRFERGCERGGILARHRECGARAPFRDVPDRGPNGRHTYGGGLEHDKGTGLVTRADHPHMRGLDDRP